MKEEKKKRGQDKKIVPFEINDEIFADPDIDQMVKESLIQEANELEAKLNADPRLTGVGASDDLLQSIVGKLKEQGIWEDESSEDSGDNAGEQKPPTTLEGFPHRKDTAGSVSARKGYGADSEVRNSEEGNAPEAAHHKTDVELSAEIGVVTDRADTEPGRAGDVKSEIPERSENTAVNGQSLEELYALLPEEDRRALQLGREVEQKQQRKMARRRSRRRVLRYGGIAAAVMATLFGVGMTSEANRRLVQKAWDVMAANFNFHVQTDYTGEEDQVRSKSWEEVEAMEQISKNLDVSAISFERLPSGMEYEYYDIVTDGIEALMFYSYQDTIFTVTIINVNLEGSAYYVMDENAEPVKTITTEQYFDAKIWETNQNLDEEYRAYIAEIDYEGCRYILNGMLPLEEMEKIVKFTFIL